MLFNVFSIDVETMLLIDAFSRLRFLNREL